MKLMIAEVRTQRGMTQEQLAQALQMSLSGVQYLETKATNVKLYLLDQLCEVLQCEPGDLLKRFNNEIEEESRIAREKARQQRSERMKQRWAEKRQQSKQSLGDAA